MPYGVDKDLGGDNKSNDGWMEKCVTSVIDKTGKDKSSAIAICKAQLKKNKEAKSEQDFTLDLSIVDKETKYRNGFIRKQMQAGLTFQQARSAYEANLSRTDYNIV